ncbi:unnamed protein product [Parajaminaea phylloscopi]
MGSRARFCSFPDIKPLTAYLLNEIFQKHLDFHATYMHHHGLLFIALTGFCLTYLLYASAATAIPVSSTRQDGVAHHVAVDADPTAYRRSQAAFTMSSIGTTVKASLNAIHSPGHPGSWTKTLLEATPQEIGASGSGLRPQSSSLQDHPGQHVVNAGSVSAVGFVGSSGEKVGHLKVLHEGPSDRGAGHLKVLHEAQSDRGAGHLKILHEGPSDRGAGHLKVRHEAQSDRGAGHFKVLHEGQSDKGAGHRGPHHSVE